MLCSTFRCALAASRTCGEEELGRISARPQCKCASGGLSIAIVNQLPSVCFSPFYQRVRIHIHHGNRDGDAARFRRRVRRPTFEAVHADKGPLM